ncbi:hypothetical protein PtA15_17A70 [Puccinia triticina]|uniref:V-type proton ATPase subunit G n=1 Tax=Puccinia triticina TaxID=208348 RepID=A0ABY7D753_9BASI|nr:uncharacterized protein PtA15_17A70 [Puccinia triticina]WAQ92589.1 hypothetical protein PtA15_17A70 [Puccinia triticina]
MATPSAGPDDADNGSKQSFLELAQQAQAARNLIIKSRAKIESHKFKEAYLKRKIKASEQHSKELDLIIHKKQIIADKLKQNSEMQGM